jgi:hypothetical protein
MDIGKFNEQTSSKPITLPKPSISSAKQIETRIPQIIIKNSPEPSKQILHKPSSSAQI